MTPAEVAIRLAAASTAAGEPPPFSDQTLVDLRAGRAVVLGDADGVAVVRDGELEVVVGLEARGRGIGTRLVTQALALGAGAAAVDGAAAEVEAAAAAEPRSGPGTTGSRGSTSGTQFDASSAVDTSSAVDERAAAAPRAAWAHGDHPGARALARRFGWSATRTLLQLRASVPADGAEPGLQTDWSLTTFAGTTEASAPATTDESDWLALNATAFASHPEQGRMTLDDLRAREADDWFRGKDLLLLRDDEAALVGSCWLKVEDGIGEFYAVAVRPDRQGQGLGGVLMRAGWQRLRERGTDTAALYVEGDNAPALALYRRQGFTDHAVDVQYSAP